MAEQLSASPEKILLHRVGLLYVSTYAKG